MFFETFGGCPANCCHLQSPVDWLIRTAVLSSFTKPHQTAFAPHPGLRRCITDTAVGNFFSSVQRVWFHFNPFLPLTHPPNLNLFLGEPSLYTEWTLVWFPFQWRFQTSHIDSFSFFPLSLSITLSQAQSHTPNPSKCTIWLSLY